MVNNTVYKYTHAFVCYSRLNSEFEGSLFLELTFPKKPDNCTNQDRDQQDTHDSGEIYKIETNKTKSISKTKTIGF